MRNRCPWWLRAALGLLSWAIALCAGATTPRVGAESLSEHAVWSAGVSWVALGLAP